MSNTESELKNETVDQPYLLPCPFCGADTDIELQAEDNGVHEPVMEYNYFCSRCGSVAALGCCSSEESALAAWNRRPNASREGRRGEDSENQK